MCLTQKKQRLELFFKMEAANQLKRQEASRKESMDMSCNKNLDISSPSYDAELNAATASIISLPVDTSSPIITTHGDVSSTIFHLMSFNQNVISFKPDSPANSQLYQFHEVLPLSHTSDDLRRTAGEILNGVRRNVEVQIMHPNELQSYSILNSGSVGNFSCFVQIVSLLSFPTEDYLNPISKEEIMQESGLGRRYDEFYLIDSGINMTSANGTDEPTEVFEIFHEDFNLNYFGNNNIIAWQRAGDGAPSGKQVFVKIN